MLHFEPLKCTKPDHKTILEVFRFAAMPGVFFSTGKIEKRVNQKQCETPEPHVNIIRTLLLLHSFFLDETVREDVSFSRNRTKCSTTEHTSTYTLYTRNLCAYNYIPRDKILYNYIGCLFSYRRDRAGEIVKPRARACAPRKHVKRGKQKTACIARSSNSPCTA